MQVFPKKLVTTLRPFWQERCKYAHPSGNFADANNTFTLMTEVEWLLTRAIDQERIQDYTVVIECAEDKDFTLDPIRAIELIKRLHENQYESLARWVLLKRLSLGRSVESGKLLALWQALKPLLSDNSRRRLMERELDPLLKIFLVPSINPGEQPPAIDQVISVAEMAQFMFWSEVNHDSWVWEYFDQRLEDDLMNRGIVTQLRQYAPSPYRERIFYAWPNV